MKTKTNRGNAIIGIAMAAIMLASVLVAMIGSTGADSTGGPYNIILNQEAPVQSVLIGQDLDFSAWGTGSADIITIYRVKDNAVVWTKKAGSDNTLTISGADWIKEGAFYVNYTNSTIYDAQLSFSDPDVPLTLKVGEKTVSSIAIGTPLRIDTGGINLFGNDTVDLEIIGPDGPITTKNGQLFTNISVNNLTTNFGNATNTTFNIDTTGWKVGSYTFQIKTKSEYACGLNAYSDIKSLSITKGVIDIKAEPTSTTELKIVKLTVTGVAGRNITVSGDSKHVIFRVGERDNPKTTGAALRKDGVYITLYYEFNHTIDADSTRTYNVKFNETGSYTITVKDWTSGEDDTVDITVSEKAVVFDLPASVAVGEKITIKGTATSGTYVDIWIDDVLRLDQLVIEDGEFSEEVTTTNVGMTVPGSVRIKAYIDSTITTLADLPVADGDTAILLTKPGLTAELSVTAVAIEDYFTVSGIARGSTSVEILCVPPKGGGGKSLLDNGKTGLSPERIASVSTTDDTFTKRLTVQKDATAGYYDIYVLSKGMDGTWGMTGVSDLYGAAGALEANYGITKIESPDNDVGTKTQEDMKNIFVDLTTSPGADDLYWLGRLKVETPHVTLDSIASVGVGEPLVVTGTSNRREGFAIVITVKMGTEELTPQTVSVENGTFSATFNTTGVARGTYTVKADDGDGHIDEVTVDIVTAVPVTPTPTEEVTATPEVTPTIPALETPTPTVEEPTPTPTPTPGFEAVFAIAGLLAVAYLVLRKRR